MRDLSLSQATYYSHFNLLLDHGYLTVERRKNNGRFDVSLYRLAETVEAPHPPPKGKRKAMSEKSAHGRNGDTGGNLADKGEAPPPMSEIVMSEEPLSEISAHGKPGQANINNNSTTNNFLEKEQGYYHQGGAPDDKKTVPLLSLEQAKEIIRYEKLRCEALAWGELKTKLGHFPAPRGKTRYIRRVIEILDETARQAQKKLNATHDPQRVAAILESEAFTAFFGEVLDRWDEIRSAKGYVGASLRNMLDR